MILRRPVGNRHFVASRSLCNLRAVARFSSSAGQLSQLSNVSPVTRLKCFVLLVTRVSPRVRA